MIRKDFNDLIFRTEKEKYDAITKKIIECNKIGQPILVGTTSIEKSEKISKFLKAKNLKHNILNAKFHEQEAKIISEAGKVKRNYNCYEYGRARYRYKVGRKIRSSK